MKLTVRDIERFWAKVDKKGPDECWNWTASLRDDGYGQFFIAHTEPFVWKAHRVSWVLHRGMIPAELCVCHTCDNPICVNDSHLFLGTRADNNHDRTQKGRGHQGLPSIRGENNPSSKLTWEAVRSIRRLRREQGLTYKVLASRFGVCLSTICLIVHDKAWLEAEGLNSERA